MKQSASQWPLQRTLRLRVVATATSLGLLLIGCGRLGFELHPETRQGSGSSRSVPGTLGVDESDETARDDAETGTNAQLVELDADAQVVAPDAEAEVVAPDAGSSPSADAGSPSLGITIAGRTNLSVDNRADRTCTDGGEMVSYSVLELTPTSATLATSPAPGCIATGDELLLINLQGSSMVSARVGNFELLRVAYVTGSEVGFTTSKQNPYGGGVDDHFGTTRSLQRVVVQRVPRYRDLTIAQGAVVRGDAWDGVRGGVFALRVAGTLRVDGTITMAGAGYVGGRKIDPEGTTGMQGESIAGLGDSSTSENFGAGGGGLGGGLGCGQDGAPGGGAGHVAVGRAAQVMACDALGPGTGGMLIGDDTKLLMGSGGGSGGTSTSRTDNPPGGAGGRGGGAILILADAITGAGVIDASGTDGQGDDAGVECSGVSDVSCWDRSGPGGGGAGGSVFLRAAQIESSVAIRARGGVGGNGNDSLSGNGGAASAGRIVITSP